MVKGLATTLVVVLSILGVVVILVSLLPTLVSETINQKIDIQKNVYNMENALVAAKLYTRTALRYSLYQSCYDNLKGLDKQEKGLPEEEKFINLLENETGKYFEVYTREKYSFLRQYEVELPDYSVKVAEIKPETINVTADSGFDLFIEKTGENETIVIEKDPSIDETIKTPCFGLFLKGKELEAAVKERAAETITGELKKWPENGILIADENPSDPDVFKAATGEKGFEVNSEEEAEAILEDRINQSLLKAFSGFDENGFEIHTNPITEVDITIKCTSGISINQEGKFEKECSFYYKADALTAVHVTEEDAKHPVFNGTDIAFEPLRLDFAVKSSGLHPKEPFTE